jgi:hypothetical protein
MNKEFENYLKQTNMSANTISAYMFAVRFYELTYKDCKRNLLLCKSYLTEIYNPKTVNLRIQAMNKYLEFIKRES